MIDKAKILEYVNDPAKLEAKLKEFWGKIDEKGEGAVPLEVLKAKAETFAKNKGIMALPEFRLPTEEEKAKARQIADPITLVKSILKDSKNLLMPQLKKQKKKVNFKLLIKFIN
jgi:hypothetical protein